MSAKIQIVLIFYFVFWDYNSNLSNLPLQDNKNDDVLYEFD